MPQRRSKEIDVNTEANPSKAKSHLSGIRTNVIPGKAKVNPRRKARARDEIPSNGDPSSILEDEPRIIVR